MILLLNNNIIVWLKNYLNIKVYKTYMSVKIIIRFKRMIKDYKFNNNKIS